MIHKLLAAVFVFWLGAISAGSLTFYRCAKDGRAYFAGEHIQCRLEKKHEAAT